MAVPFNGAFCRLLCKFVALLGILLLLAWTFAQRQKCAGAVDELEGQLRFAQTQLSSLHAQIEVITRHKEKIETLLEEQTALSRHKNNEQAQRIASLEAENLRLGKALARINESRPFFHALPPSALQNRSNAAQIEEVEEKRVLKKPDQGQPEEKPMVEPVQEEPEEEEEVERRKEELEKRHEDPFDGGKEKPKVEEKPEEKPGVGKEKPEKEKPEDREEKSEVKEKAEKKPTRKKPNGAEEKPEEKPEVEEKPDEKPDEKEEKPEKKPTRKEPNGAEKAEDYVFQRPKPRQDLVFHRQDGGGGEAVGMEEAVGGGNWMSAKEMARKLAEKAEAEKRRRANRAMGKEP